METVETRHDWRTVGSWRTGIVLALLLAAPFIEYAGRWFFGL
jgi:hypothetical protein